MCSLVAWKLLWILGFLHCDDGGRLFVPGEEHFVWKEGENQNSNT